MGNPHCVVFGGDPAEIEIEKVGPKFETAALFPDRTNTEFVQVLGGNEIKMRVWERGSGETWACGTARARLPSRPCSTGTPQGTRISSCTFAAEI